MAKEKFNPYNHFGFLTNRTGRLIGKHFTSEMRKQGLDMPPSCIGILAELWVQDGLSQKKIGLSIIKTKSSVNKMLRQMIEANLIVKKTDEKDRRISRIFLTKKGQALEEKIIKIGIGMENNLLAEHNAKEIEITKKVLTTLYHNLTNQQTNT